MAFVAMVWKPEEQAQVVSVVALPGLATVEAASQTVCLVQDFLVPPDKVWKPEEQAQVVSVVALPGLTTVEAASQVV
jgi:ethanolamine ammonia-lyase small subunit